MNVCGVRDIEINVYLLFLKPISCCFRFRREINNVVALQELETDRSTKMPQWFEDYLLAIESTAWSLHPPFPLWHLCQREREGAGRKILSHACDSFSFSSMKFIFVAHYYTPPFLTTALTLAAQKNHGRVARSDR